MTRKHGILVCLAVVTLLAAGGVTTSTVTSQPPAAPRAETVALPAPEALKSEACDASADLAAGVGDAGRVKPGCCSTQCNADKDCDRICGKGVCACIQETPCCRRCVY